jgi:general secretion pathway protein A
MYHQHFGLNEAPFSIAVNPRYLFMSQRHRDALAHLLYGVSGGGGFILLTGEVGTGKTTVNRCLLEQLPDTTDLAIILNPALSAVELLATACDELKIDYPRGTQSLKELTDALHRYLLDNYERGRKTVLMIDEAQHLDFNVLEQIRLLTNLETNDEKLLQIILIGQPELTEKLSRPELRQLNQRITARYNLQPLNLQETTAYIKHRLEVAGLRGGVSLFETAAIKQIHALTRGIPRLINVLCDRALLGAYGQQRGSVNKKLIAQAASEVFGGPATQPSASPALPLWVLLVTVIAVAGLVIGVWISQADSPSDDDSRVSLNYEPPSKSEPTKSKNSVLTEPTELVPSPSSTQPRQPTPAVGNTTDRSVVGSDGALTVSTPGWQLSLQEASNVFWQAAMDSPVPTSVCPPPQISGLQCTRETVQVWNELMKLNRPVLLEMVTEDKFAAAAFVLSFRDASALTWTRQGLLQVSLSELAQRWSGGVQYLWQAPKGWKGSVGRGDKSPIVDVLAQMFATLDGMSVPEVKAYGPALEARVRLFQQAEGIVSDGVVGEQTILRLNDRLGIGLTSKRAINRSAMWPVKPATANTQDMRDLR